MVNIAIAGGSSQPPSPFPYPPIVTWFQTDYSPSALTTALTSHTIHTVLSFTDARHDPHGASQIALIKSCLGARVRRFAPAEWSVSHTPAALDDGKAPIRAYLQEINTPVTQLEYCLFQPGLFMNYLAAPNPTGARYIRQLQTWFDLGNRRAIVIEGEEDTARISWTTVQDLAGVVARAVEYEGVWPTVGGMCGGELTARELIELGERIRGGKFEVTRLKRGDVERGEIRSDWVPILEHPSIPEEMREVFSRAYVQHALLEGMHGGFSVGDEWNRIFPDYKFTSPEEFLKAAWDGKP
ncbi:hypothetical protein B0T16DRAFT_431477 [Cercophora newfieldiana]|uniref:NmrA-like domain-containing protein n=1 Tax=Cercophora newfieldiana TaxID=92897 RepID=A0AA40CLF5_9PEZI|nr:hypothetical protein B0T16DRAFT_431477 [Cercophora newfieldiana]